MVSNYELKEKAVAKIFELPVFNRGSQTYSIRSMVNYTKDGNRTIFNDRTVRADNLNDLRLKLIKNIPWNKEGTPSIVHINKRGKEHDEFRNLNGYLSLNKKNRSIFIWHPHNSSNGTDIKVDARSGKLTTTMYYHDTATIYKPKEKAPVSVGKPTELNPPHPKGYFNIYDLVIGGKYPVREKFKTVADALKYVVKTIEPNQSIYVGGYSYKKTTYKGIERIVQKSGSLINVGFVDRKRENKTRFGHEIIIWVHNEPAIINKDGTVSFVKFTKPSLGKRVM